MKSNWVTFSNTLAVMHAPPIAQNKFFNWKQMVTFKFIPWLNSTESVEFVEYNFELYSILILLKVVFYRMYGVFRI